MKFLKLSFAFIALFFSLNVAAQTVDGIISKHIDAMGGKEKMLTLKTMKKAGAMNVNGVDVSIVTTRSHNIGSRNDIEVMGTSNYEVVNDKQGWIFMPIFHMAEPTAMEPKKLAAEQNMYDLQGPFVNYKEKGNTIELKGSEKIDGADAWNLLVTYKNGSTMNYYIDKSTYRVMKTTSLIVADGEEKLEKLLFADYKQNADGYWFSYSITNDRGTIYFTSIETNVKVEDSLFTKK